MWFAVLSGQYPWKDYSRGNNPVGLQQKMGLCFIDLMGTPFFLTLHRMALAVRPRDPDSFPEDRVVGLSRGSDHRSTFRFGFLEQRYSFPVRQCNRDPGPRTKPLG